MKEPANHLMHKPAHLAGTIPPRPGNLSILLLGGLRTFVC